jgi:hypothetical protein
VQDCHVDQKGAAPSFVVPDNRPTQTASGIIGQYLNFCKAELFFQKLSRAKFPPKTRLTATRL